LRPNFNLIHNPEFKYLPNFGRQFLVVLKAVFQTTTDQTTSSGTGKMKQDYVG